MPAPIINGLITFLSQELQASVWDGEIPRYDVAGEPINPDDTTVTPIVWPAIKLFMNDQGFDRTLTTEDPYDDLGPITIKVYSTTREQVELFLGVIDDLLSQAHNWVTISQTIAGSSTNPYYVISILLNRWTSVQEEGVRTSDSQLLYRGELEYNVDIHGAVSFF